MNGSEIGLKGNDIIDKQPINIYIDFQVNNFKRCLNNALESLEPTDFFRVDSLEVYP